MSQLIMRWKNDGKQTNVQLPTQCRMVNFTQLDNAMEEWLDIVQYGLSQGRMDEEYYHLAMTSRPTYKEENCFFLLEDDQAVATIAVLCDYEKKEGYIHMVACKESVRGKGYGTLLSEWAVLVLKREGMETAYLTTDDWRIPAIKTNLATGFVGDLSTDDFKERWAKIHEQLGK